MPGISTQDGFAGFALALPNLVPDIGNVTGPPEWDNSTGIDVPNAVEWDRDDDNGGIMPGQTGVFSFTTLPRPITLGDGLFHTWIPVPGEVALGHGACRNLATTSAPRRPGDNRRKLFKKQEF